MLSDCFLGLELFAAHITNKITNHYCEFWFLQLLWSYSDECLSQTDSKAVSWNFHFSDDRSNTLNARPLIEISGWVFFFGISKVWREENCSKYGYQNRAHPAHLLCHFLRRVNSTRFCQGGVQFLHPLLPAQAEQWRPCCVTLSGSGFPGAPLFSSWFKRLLWRQLTGHCPGHVLQAVLLLHRLDDRLGAYPVSYTHLTLPTKA